VKAVFRWWATWVFIAIVVQVGLAGYGAFYTVHKLNPDGATVNENTFEDGFGFHVVWGYLGVGLSILILVLIGLIAGIGKWRLGRQGVLFGLFILQVLLAWIGAEVPAVGFFHPVNALVIFGLAGTIAYTTWREARAPAAQASAAV
jgi:hypothetical protein